MLEIEVNSSETSVYDINDTVAGLALKNLVTTLKQLIDASKNRYEVLLNALTAAEISINGKENGSGSSATATFASTTVVNE